jgi:hypothetical protein
MLISRPSKATMESPSLCSFQLTLPFYSAGRERPNAKKPEGSHGICHFSWTFKKLTSKRLLWVYPTTDRLWFKYLILLFFIPFYCSIGLYFTHFHFIPFKLIVSPQIFQFYLSGVILNDKIKHFIIKIENPILSVKWPSSISHFSFRSNNSSTVNSAFEMSHSDCYHAIVTFNNPVWIQLTDFSNPFLIELLELEINHDLFTDFVIRLLNLFWINATPNECFEWSFVRIDFVFHSRKSCFLRDFIEFFLWLLKYWLQIYLNSHELCFECWFNWSLIHRIIVFDDEISGVTKVMTQDIFQSYCPLMEHWSKAVWINVLPDLCQRSSNWPSSVITQSFIFVFAYPKNQKSCDEISGE